MILEKKKSRLFYGQSKKTPRTIDVQGRRERTNAGRPIVKDGREERKPVVV